MSSPEVGSGRGRTLAIFLACVVLTLLFVLWLFPYDRLGGFLTGQLQAATGAQVVIGSVETGLAGGPALVAQELVLSWPDGTEFTLERVAVRPALAFSWLRGAPALHVDLMSPAGHIVGTLWPGAPLAFDGSGTALDPAALPPALLGDDPPPIAGLLDADLELATSEAGILHGQLEFRSEDGSLLLPDPPIAIPYTALAGELSRDESGETTLHALTLEGPLLSLEGRGTLGASRHLELAPLSLDVTIRSVEPALEPLLAPLGISLDSNGETGLQITGTLSQPVFRVAR